MLVKGNPNRKKKKEALLDWFIDIRSTLKARLPRKMFKTQCQVFYEIPVEKRIVFSNRWIKNWMREYEVSLRHPNKRFQIKQADREERVFEYLKNIWTVRKFFLDNFGVDPPLINGDQMPLHGNESSSQKTLNFTGMDTYVKEYRFPANELPQLHKFPVTQISHLNKSLFSREKALELLFIHLMV